MPDVVALGEILIDFTPFKTKDGNSNIFEKNPGGAPANFLAILSKLGISTAFIGKAGDDIFGRYLKDLLVQKGIDTSGLILSDKYNTTLSFVELNKSGDRTFDFIRNSGADKTLSPSEVNISLLDNAKIFHFGGLSLTDEPSRTATFETVKQAKKRGLLITFDPNYREPLWKSATAANYYLCMGLKCADIVKLSDSECAMLSGEKDPEKASNLLMRKYNIRLLFVTMGENGAAFRLGTCYCKRPAFDVKTIDTTGAGDAFFGAAVYSFLHSGKKLGELRSDDIDKFLNFANAAGSIVTSRRGALTSMPSLSEINTLLAGKQ